MTDFERALDMHRKGLFDQAELLYLEILSADPDHQRCLRSLGQLHAQKGRLTKAVSFMTRALKIDPSSAPDHNRLGVLYQQLGQRQEALQSFLSALEQDENYSEAYIGLGSVYQALGQMDAAETSFRKALQINPDFAEACANLGAVLRQRGCYEEAEAVLRHAIVCKPQMAEAHNNLGVVLHEQKHMKEAFMAFKAALVQDPEYADAYNNMGSVFRDQNQTEAALACYGKALVLDETSAEAHNNQGSIHQSLGNLEAAEKDFRRAIELKPGLLTAFVNLGTTLHKKGQHAEAQALFEQVIEVDPENVQAHFALAEILLYVGEDLSRAWQEYKWRWKRPEFQSQKREFGCPEWCGEPLVGKTILVTSEEGVGEEILYSTMLPDLIDQGGNVILECEPRLLALFARSFPKVRCMARENFPNWTDLDAGADYQCAAGDLAPFVRPTLSDFPGQSPLLQADQAHRDALRRQYSKHGDGPLVGIAWHSKNLLIGWEKSIDLKDFHAVLENKGAVFVDLQYGDTQTERRSFEAATGIQLIHDETIDQMQNLDAFAAQIAAMDLVISISNTTVHMAGGLGVPTLTLLSSVPLWRWFKDQDTCLWYPSVQFFRQSRPGEWSSAFKSLNESFDIWLERRKKT